MFALESVAVSIELGLPNRLKYKDAVTDAWIRKSSQQMAAQVRQLKRYVLLPKAGDHQRLTEELCKLFVNVVRGHWAPIQDTEMVGANSFFSRLLYGLRILFSVGFPILVIIILQLKIIPFTLNETVMSYVNAVMLGWILLNVMSLIDPKFDKKIGSLFKAADLFKKGKD